MSALLLSEKYPKIYNSCYYKIVRVFNGVADKPFCQFDCLVFTLKLCQHLQQQRKPKTHRDKQATEARVSCL